MITWYFFAVDDSKKIPLNKLVSPAIVFWTVTVPVPAVKTVLFWDHQKCLGLRNSFHRPSSHRILRA